MTSPDPRNDDSRVGGEPASDRAEPPSLNVLFDAVYSELREIAHHRLRHMGRGETLNTTALVHEAYLRLADRTRPVWVDRAHFCALASRAMRFVLVDYARARSAQKRGGPEAKASVDRMEIAADERAVELLALDETLQRLADREPRLAQLIEYRFFGGLSYEEIAEVTQLSVPTVKRDWRRARSWLYLEMTDHG
jgi:RNA polymerase sigma factor (TIGR02999 family)